MSIKTRIIAIKNDANVNIKSFIDDDLIIGIDVQSPLNFRADGWIYSSYMTYSCQRIHMNSKKYKKAISMQRQCEQEERNKLKNEDENRRKGT